MGLFGEVSLLASLLKSVLSIIKQELNIGMNNSLLICRLTVLNNETWKSGNHEKFTEILIGKVREDSGAPSAGDKKAIIRR